MSSPQVFISYAGADVDWARSFAEALQKQQITVWFDQFDVAPGQPWREALEAGLRDSDVLVTLVHRDLLKKPALYFELGAAIADR